MIKPIYEKNTVLYGNDGKYRLIEKNGNTVTYEFIPWSDDNSIIRQTELKELSNILGIRLLWAVFEDI